jgi:hypothetical protein
VLEELHHYALAHIERVVGAEARTSPAAVALPRF